MKKSIDLSGYVCGFAWICGWISVDACMELYGYVHGFVWICAWVCMDMYMALYVYVYGFLWMCMWICMDRCMDLYGDVYVFVRLCAWISMDMFTDSYGYSTDWYGYVYGFAWMFIDFLIIPEYSGQICCKKNRRELQNYNIILDSFVKEETRIPKK